MIKKGCWETHLSLVVRENLMEADMKDKYKVKQVTIQGKLFV